MMKPFVLGWEQTLSIVDTTATIALVLQSIETMAGAYGIYWLTSQLGSLDST